MNCGYWLRLLKPTDFDFLLKIENDPVNREYSSLSEKTDEHTIRSFLLSDHNFEKYHQLRQVIDSEQGAAGFIDLYDANFQRKEAGVGIFVEDSFRRKGAAVSALKLLQNQMREKGFEMLYAFVKITNLPSCSLFLKAGYALVAEDGALKKFELRL